MAADMFMLLLGYVGKTRRASPDQPIFPVCLGVKDIAMFCVLRRKMRSHIRGGASFKGIEILRQGVIKHIGDGVSGHIWEAPWLPYLWTRRPITPRGNTVYQGVSDLVDPYTNLWDVQLIDELFWRRWKVNSCDAIEGRDGRCLGMAS